MTELKPCPFCGGEAILYIDCGYYIAECEDCEAMSGEHETAEETIEAWNKRTSCKWKAFCEQGDTCVAHEGYDILKRTAFKEKGAKTNDVDRFNALDLLKVMKMVKKPHTNEEYIKSCTTKQLADVLFKIWENGYNSTIDRSKPFSFLFGEEWLKEERK